MDMIATFRWILYFCVFVLLHERSVFCEIQSFIVAPRDTRVIEGRSTILKCHVANQVGTVQWSRAGELLGFDPEIPGYPRYNIVGNASLGIYNLKIMDTTLEDEADYECQVGPAEGQDAIIGKAHLTILLQPTSIQIVGRENGSEVQIEMPNSVSLECEVKGGKPAPDVRWYRNSFRLSNELSRTSVSDEDGGRQTVKSILNIIPNSDDNKAVYVCEARTTFSSRKLKTYVILDVLYPPGKPFIEGYRTSEKIRAGELVDIKCVSRLGNPLARLVWTKNGEFIDHSYTTSDFKATNEISFTASASDDGAIYTCTASSIMTPQPLVDSIVLQVLYAPASVSIKAPKEGKPGDVITATCKTEPSNPASEVTWVIDGRPMTSENEVKVDSRGGWVTTSKIDVNVTQQDRNSKVFMCYAVNQELGETITHSFTVDILYAPDPPRIFGYVEDTAIHAGKLQRLTCISNSGNPLPQLTWFKGEQELTGSQSSTRDTTVSKEITIIAAADDNGAKYHCKSSSKALSEPLITTVTLTVYFPPSLPNIKVKPKKPKAGSEVRLTCECSGSNPAANITWWRSGTKEEILDSSSTTTISEGDNQGFSSKSSLTINITSEDDNTKYSCQATNEAIQQSSYNAIVLHVFYKPVFKISDQYLFEVKENESTVIDITAKANPEDITYKWSKDNETIWEGSVFNITEAQRSQSGAYDCLAKNEIGESSITVILKVLYPMKIIRDSNETDKIIIAEPNSNVKLECRAVGYPLKKEALTWTYASSSNMQDRTEINTGSNGKSILLVKNVTKDIAGPFTCQANNGIGSPDNWKIFLLVKHEPLIKDFETYNSVFSDRGKSVELQCKAEGVPEVLFSWSMEGVVISTGKNSRIKHEVTKVDHFVWKSVITIEDVNMRDFGDYKCVAKNEISFVTAEISLFPDSAPDPPVLVKVTNISRYSLHVVWVPGFSGGHNQTHRIRYKSTAELVSSYQDVHPSSSNSTWIRNLKPDTEYEIAMMSLNAKGSSPYTTDKIKARTLELAQKGYKTNDEEFSLNGSLVEILVSTVGTVFLLLFVFNIILLALYYRKKKPKTKRKYSSDYSEDVSSSSDTRSTSSRDESEMTTFSSFTSDSRESDDRISSYTSKTTYSEHKSISYESSDVNDEYSEYSSATFSKAYRPSKFI